MVAEFRREMEGVKKNRAYKGTWRLGPQLDDEDGSVTSVMSFGWTRRRGESSRNLIYFLMSPRKTYVEDFEK